MNTGCKNNTLAASISMRCTITVNNSPLLLILTEINKKFTKYGSLPRGFQLFHFNLFPLVCLCAWRIMSTIIIVKTQLSQGPAKFLGGAYICNSCLFLFLFQQVLKRVQQNVYQGCKFLSLLEVPVSLSLLPFPSFSFTRLSTSSAIRPFSPGCRR